MRSSVGAFIRPHAWTLLAAALTGWRRGLFAALALVVLLAAGALLVGRSEWKFLETPRTLASNFENRRIGRETSDRNSPFVNQSDDSAREYFADGLTQDIINALGRFSELTVMSWNAVFPYKGRPASPGRSPAVSRCAIRSKAASARPATACA